MLSAPAAVYRPRSPQSSDYYRCIRNGDDVAFGVAISEDGSAVFLTGVTGGVLPLNLLTAGYSGGGDLFIAKFDSVPNLKWTTYLGSTAMDAGMAITVRGGWIKVTGVTQGTLPGKTSAGGSDIIVASYHLSPVVMPC